MDIRSGAMNGKLGLISLHMADPWSLILISPFDNIPTEELKRQCLIWVVWSQST